MDKELLTYWDSQSKEYSDVNQEELETQIKSVWTDLINQYRPDGQKLKVLDIGCGPGFFSILMAQQGHEVTAVDFSNEMIEQASCNVKKYCPYGNISFRQMDAQQLEFQDETFDLVLSRNITWTLQDPKRAYSQWIRVLKTGGRMLNFDGNWRLHYYHDYLARLVKKAEQDCIRKGFEILPDGHDHEHAGNALDNLPLADKLRPFWDVDCLTEIADVKTKVIYELPNGIMNDYYTTMYQYSPMFMVMAEKQ